MLDLLIKGATVVDGTNRPGFSADVGIVDGRIAEVGRISAVATRTLDADGLTLTPGFVDLHTHYDGQVSWDTMLAPSSLNGVTSVGLGNCGVGFAPVHAHDHDRLIRLLEGVEDIPGTALSEGLTWDWESFPDYLSAIERRDYAVDIGAHVPHAPLRLYVMGERGADQNESPTDAEIARMEELTLEALRAGAMGFSTSRSIAHKSIDGENIGTRISTERELGLAARALRAAGTGVIQLISDMYMDGEESFVDSEMHMIRNLARQSGRPLSFSLMQVPHRPTRWQTILDRVDEMARDGLDVRVQVAPRPIGIILGLRASLNPFSMTETFRKLTSEPLAERVATLSRPEVKAQILAEKRQVTHDDALSDMVGRMDQLFRMNDPVDYNPAPETSILAEAGRAGREYQDYLYDAVLEQDGRRLLYFPALNYADGDLAAVHAMIKADRALYGLSDGGAHCGTICDATFPTTSLALWSGGDRGGRRVGLERLVHGYTQRNAAHVGWRDRGVIAPGYLADINVIDLDSLALPPPDFVSDLPASGSRLIQKPRGYHWTVKTGTITFDHGEATGALPGKLLRGEQPL